MNIKNILLIIHIFFSIKLLVAQDYNNLIIDYFKTKKEFSLNDIHQLEIYNQSTSKKTGVTHVYAMQKLYDIPIYNAMASIAIKDNKIIYERNTLHRNISEHFNILQPKLSAIQASKNAIKALQLKPRTLAMKNQFSNKTVISQKEITEEDITLKLVYYPKSDNELSLCWFLKISTLDKQHHYGVHIDASTGKMVKHQDYALHCNFETPHTAKHFEHGAPLYQKKNKRSIVGKKSTMEQYNVYAQPIESPLHGTNTIVSSPQNLDASPFGWHDVDGVLGADFTITRGNNVYAFEDIDADNTVGVSPDGGSDLIFDFPYDFSTSPLNNIDASTTNLFYWCNIIHDVLYQYGFDEEAGNFQQTNYTSQGLQDDPVLAIAQDRSGVNNAVFQTRPDGEFGVMQMFLWRPPGLPANRLTINNGTLSGGYGAVPALFGPPLPETTAITQDLALVQDDNASMSTDTEDACDMITNGSSLFGKIAVVRRGICDFSFKVLSAENEGAVAVIVVNNVLGLPFNMGGGSEGPNVTIPSVMVNMDDGEAIITALKNGEVINASIQNTGPFMTDGSLDGGIIAHEYAHGLSVRLTGGALNADCLFNDEQMGEGWSDYLMLMLTTTSANTADQPRTIGNFSVGQDINGSGIRIAPYSTDFSVNNLTYDATNSSSVSVPHGIGTVWATMLWDMTWMLIDEYGFDDDIYNGIGGNNIALQLVIDGLKLQPCSPGFVDGRDAILAAVDINPLIDFADKNRIKCNIWEVFARRGLGVSADQGSTSSRTDQVEAFDTPDISDPLSPCNSGVVLSNVNDIETIDNISIYPNPSEDYVILNIPKSLRGDGDISILDLNGRNVYTKQGFLEDKKLDIGNLQSGVYIIVIKSETIYKTIKLIVK